MDKLGYHWSCGLSNWIYASAKIHMHCLCNPTQWEVFWGSQKAAGAHRGTTQHVMWQADWMIPLLWREKWFTSCTVLQHTPIKETANVSKSSALYICICATGQENKSYRKHIKDTFFILCVQLCAYMKASVSNWPANIRVMCNFSTDIQQHISVSTFHT